MGIMKLKKWIKSIQSGQENELGNFCKCAQINEMTIRWGTPFILSILLLAGCEGENQTDSNTSGQSEESNGAAISAPVDYLGAVANAKKSMEGKLALSQLSQAVQNYQIENGKLPASLDALLESDHLSRLPKVPYKTKLSYDSKTGVVDLVAANQ